MAAVLVKVPVSLNVLGPILTAGATRAAWGVDVTFYRDWLGSLALPGSHIRGKLREAMEEIDGIQNQARLGVKEWFGDKSGDTADMTESYLPVRGILKVTDFVVSSTTEESARERTRTRIRIEPDRGAVDEGAMLIAESPFSSGEEVQWSGSVEFFCAEGEVTKLIEKIRKAFHFVTSVGAEKTVGYGRLKNVEFGDAMVVRAEPVQPADGNQKGLKLSVAPQEPLLIGGVRPRENIFVSEKIIPGAVLKGAFAVGLNRLAGNPLLHAPIDEKNSEVIGIYPCLGRHFTGLRFLHAIPGLEAFDRAETAPLSLVRYGKDYDDIAFADHDSVWARNSTPVSFQIDWKDQKGIPPQYELPDLEYHPVTRTAVDDITRKADEGQLYSFHMIKPKTIQRAPGGAVNGCLPLYWNSEIHFPDGISAEEAGVLEGEIRSALPLALRYLGKRQSLVEPHLASMDQIPDRNHDSGPVAVVLQTPAIMLDPETLAGNVRDIFDDSDRLRDLYDDYWKKMLGDAATLKTFFAGQELRGGYLGMRFLKERYRPFYLTSAGSTFIIESADRQCMEVLAGLEENGLPLPAWARKAYGDLAWLWCPYIPQNGYGEIIVKNNSNGGERR